ncbi:nucleotide sugar dehydrogenase [Tepidibacter mesophilus]|uniref:nucleotide sugar dehydrogenase n=1 Tax=Tepidibacter mesophilus TaxID=655607 RepID=UPI000C07E8BA|nr:nucleotide sugar dehydrogenase [Tepidibacter mesophilus]
MKICTVGLGYIGLPTSAMFANFGAEVVGVDISKHVVDTINEGNIHIEEPGLEEMVNQSVKKGNLRASLKPEKSDVFIIAVPTPNQDDEYKSCDLSYVLSATKAVLPYIRKENVIIVESTIEPRTMDDYIKPLVEEYGFKIGQDVYLAHCPERVLPGQILHELIYNNRIVGGVTPECTKAAANVYRTFVKGEIVETEAKTAEMSKLMENTFRDVNIALANELAKVCNQLEINVLDVIQMANKHPRVNIHQPGPGVGGHCLAVDPYFIVAKAPELAGIINLSRQTNSSMPNYVLESVKKLLKGIKNPKIAALGVTYKGNVDDMRESPAVEIIEMLKYEGFEVAVHDPHVKNEILDHVHDEVAVESEMLNFISIEEAAKDADILLILTDHNEFKEYDYDKLADIMRTPQIFDTKNIVKDICYKNSDMKIINYGNLFESM